MINLSDVKNIPLLYDDSTSDSTDFILESR